MDSSLLDFAIVIGIGRYSKLPGLNTPVDDAVAFADWLRDRAGGGVSEENIRLVTSSDFPGSPGHEGPTRVDLEAAFESLRKATTLASQRARRLYIYGAGHGVAPDRDSAMLIAADASPEYFDRQIDLVDRANEFRASGAFEEVVLFADCARTSAQNLSTGIEPRLRSVSERQTKYFYAFAAQYGREAFERIGEPLSIFTGAVLEGLRGAAAGPDGSVDDRSLSTYVRSRMAEVRNRGSEHPIAEPEFRSGGADPIVFVTPSASAAAVKSSVGNKLDVDAESSAPAANAPAKTAPAKTARTRKARTQSTPAQNAPAQSAPAQSAPTQQSQMPSHGATPASGDDSGAGAAPASAPRLLDGPSTHIASDVWTVDDALGYGAYAYAIYRFMTHPQTRPPLTISIQAPWGGGKTSLMRMIQQQLDPNGSRTVQRGQDRPRGELKVGEALHEAKRWMESPPPAPAPPVGPKPTVDAKAKPSDAAKEPSAAAPVEKLPPVPHDSSRQMLTVWFNAWKYESTREVWAGLVDAIMHQVAARLPVRERELFWLRLNLKRIDVDRIRERVYDRVLRYWWRAMRWVVGGVALFLAASIVLILTTPPVIGWTVAGLTSAIGIVSSVATFLRARFSVKEEPAAVSLGDYLDVPQYAKELGFIHQVEADLRRVLDSVPQQLDAETGKPVQGQIVVFVDDLDRCSPAKVAQVIEAVNLFLGGDFPNCMFVIGMDAEMVAAALQAAHKDLVNALPKDAGIPVGWRFMDKFVQLPFIIPPMPADGLARYSESLFAATDGAPAVADDVREELRRAQERVSTPAEAVLEAERIRLAHSLDEDRAAYLRNYLRTQALQRTISVGIDRFNDKSSGIRDIIAKELSYFHGNPRELKRFVNAFRFNYFLWWAQCSQGLSAPKLEQLVRWTVLAMRWPEVVRWLRRSGGTEWSATAATASKSGELPSRLKLMEEVSGTAGDVASWQKEAGAKLRITQSDAPWLRDDDLLEFFNRESKLPAEERLSSGAGLGIW